MTTAKIFKHGGSQAIRLPKAFRFEGTEVMIEKRGNQVILSPKKKPKFKTVGDFVRYLNQVQPRCYDWPDVERPQDYDKRDLTW